MQIQSGYHTNGNNLLIENVKAGSVFFIKGSGNNNYCIGFVDAMINVLINDGYNGISYDDSSKTLTMPSAGHYRYSVIK